MLETLNPKNKAPRTLLNEGDAIARYKIVCIGTQAMAMEILEFMPLRDAQALREELQLLSYDNGYSHAEVRYAIKPVS